MTWTLLTACEPEKNSFHIPASARTSNLLDICSWSTMSLETDHRSSLSLTPCCHHSTTSGEPVHVRNPRETQVLHSYLGRAEQPAPFCS